MAYFNDLAQIILEKENVTNKLKNVRYAFVWLPIYFSKLKSLTPNTSVEFSPSHPLLALVPTCILTKSMYFKLASFPSNVFAFDILK